jgi:16S rRNA G966 N2-methylase RsmD
LENAVVLDCFQGSGTTIAAAQKLGRRWIGCDINKGAIQTTAKRLQNIITEQVQAAADNRQGSLLEDDETTPPKPAQLGFSVWRVNDYDLHIQHNEAVALVVEHLGI